MALILNSKLYRLCKEVVQRKVIIVPHKMNINGLITKPHMLHMTPQVATGKSIHYAYIYKCFHTTPQRRINPLIFIFAKVKYFTDRRFGRGRYLNQIKAKIPCSLQSFFRIYATVVFSIFINQLDFRDLDFSICPGTLTVWGQFTWTSCDLNCLLCWFIIADATTGKSLM